MLSQQQSTRGSERAKSINHEERSGAGESGGSLKSRDRRQQRQKKKRKNQRGRCNKRRAKRIDVNLAVAPRLPLFLFSPRSPLPTSSSALLSSSLLLPAHHSSSSSGACRSDTVSVRWVALGGESEGGRQQRGRNITLYNKGQVRLDSRSEFPNFPQFHFSQLSKRR